MSAQVIGYLGENGVRDVRIPIGQLLDKWQGLRPFLVMVPVGGSDDEAYPVQYTLDGTDLVWHVSDADTAVAGTTKAAVRMVDDSGRVGMDEPFQVIISPNLSSGGEPPVVIKPWVDKLATLVPRAESATERAETATERAETATERAETATERAETATERAENAAQNWESGTVPNALALGDKPPEYYLPAVNLFVNPDFSIAQAGYNSLHGNEYFCADGWTGTNNEITLSKKAGYITLTSTVGYRQIYQKLLVPDLVADAYTFAVTRRNTSVRTELYLYGENASGNATPIKSVETGTGDEWQTFVMNFTRAEVAQYTKIWCCIRNRGVGAVDYKEPVLYPGTYTAANLPPFVPTNTTLELAKCQSLFVPISIGGIHHGLIGSSGNVNINIDTPFMKGARSVAGGENLTFAIVTPVGTFAIDGFTVSKYDNVATRITAYEQSESKYFNMPFTAYTMSTSGNAYISAEP